MLMVLVIPVMLILAGFAVNLSYMELARTDLQIAADASARAAARTFARTNQTAPAIAAAQAATSRNPVVGKTLSLRSRDVLFGTATRSSASGRYVFSANRSPFNSVRVDLNSASSGSLPLPFRVGIRNTNFAGRQRATATQAELDVVLVFDKSGSMAFGSDELALPGTIPKRAPKNWVFDSFPVPPQSRLSEAQTAVREFLSILQTSAQRENVALVTYNQKASEDIPLTRTYSQINGALASLNNPFKKGGTNIGDGIHAGLDLLTKSPNKRDWAVRVMIVLTDGIHNMGHDPDDAAREAAENNVVIYTVTFATEADQGRMKKVAEIGLGKHYHAANGAALANNFREIAQNLPVLLTE